MTTTATIAGTSRSTLRDLTAAGAQKVLIVNGSSDMLDLLQSVLDGGRYDVVVVESSAHAYSQIKRVQPDLVILGLDIDDPHGFHVLSMLKLDEATREIPVITFTTEYDRETAGDDMPEPMDTEFFTHTPSAWMN